MGRFDFEASPPPVPAQPKEYRQMGGTYQCQTCYVRVRGAKYYRNDARLVWHCPEGHESTIEGFDI